MPPPMLKSSAIVHAHAVGVAEGFRGSSLPATLPSPKFMTQTHGLISKKATDQHTEVPLTVTPV